MDNSLIKMKYDPKRRKLFCTFVIHKILNGIRAMFKEILFEPAVEYSFI